MSKAFDKVNHGCLLQKLHEFDLIVLRKFFNFSLRWFEGDSFSFCLIDSFFLIKSSMAPDTQGMGFRPLSLFPWSVYSQRPLQETCLPLMPVTLLFIFLAKCFNKQLTIRSQNWLSFLLACLVFNFRPHCTPLSSITIINIVNALCLVKSRRGRLIEIDMGNQSIQSWLP